VEYGHTTGQADGTAMSFHRERLGLGLNWLVLMAPIAIGVGDSPRWQYGGIPLENIYIYIPFLI